MPVPLLLRIIQNLDKCKSPVCNYTFYVVSKNYMGCNGHLSRFLVLAVPPGVQVMPGLGFELRRKLLQ